MRHGGKLALQSGYTAVFIFKPCHNLCCAILSQVQLGIEAEFWDNDAEPEERPDVLPMQRPG